MDNQKLLIVAGVGLAVYFVLSSKANAAGVVSRPPAGAGGAPTSPGQMAREQAGWYSAGMTLGTLGAGIRGLLGVSGKGGVTNTGDETARLLNRYPAPDDAVPLNLPGFDSWTTEQDLFGSILSGGGSTGGSSYFSDFGF